MCVAWVRYKNPGALPPFPGWEGVLATKTGDPGIMAGSDIMGNEVDDVTRSMIEYEGVALSNVALVNDDPKCDRSKSRLMPRLLRPLANSTRIA